MTEDYHKNSESKETADLYTDYCICFSQTVVMSKKKKQTNIETTQIERKTKKNNQQRLTKLRNTDFKLRCEKHLGFV